MSLSGHTDAAPYAAGVKGYSNWELSADRANASRREMTLGRYARHENVAGCGPGLVGVSMNDKDHYAAVNRRIAIVVMNKRAEEAVRALGQPG